MRSALSRPTVRVGLAVALVLLLPLVATALTNSVTWTLADFAVAGVCLVVIGISIELLLRRRGNRLTVLAVGALGLLAAVWGNSDDAPGLVLLGLLLLAAAAALAVGLATPSRGTAPRRVWRGHGR